MPHQNPRKEAGDTGLPHVTWLPLTVHTRAVHKETDFF